MTALQARDHPGRRLLHAVLLNGAGDAARLLEPLARALDGSGPAILPVGKVGPTTAKYLAGLARDIEIWPVE